MNSLKAKKVLGFSILEVMVSLAILALVLAGGVQTYRVTLGSNNRLSESTSLRQVLYRAMEHILQVGRLSGTTDGTCIKGLNLLDCFIDFTVPRRGVTSQVRFLLAPEGLLYQQWDGTTFATKITYEGITGFIVCDDSDMSTNACPLEPKKMSQAYGASTVVNRRFYRVQLTAAVLPEKKHLSKLQSAFFVRNPGFNNLSYEWVSQ